MRGSSKSVSFLSAVTSQAVSLVDLARCTLLYVSACSRVAFLRVSLPPVAPLEEKETSRYTRTYSSLNRSDMEHLLHWARYPMRFGVNTKAPTLPVSVDLAALRGYSRR